MPKVYSEEKRREIKESLMRSGLEIIRQYGMKRMSIEELTKRVGIAQGTFYNFFKSKEVLVYELACAYEKRLEEEMKSVVRTVGYLSRSQLEMMYRKMFLVDEDNVYRFLKREDIQALIVRLPVECLNQMSNVRERIGTTLEYTKGGREQWDIDAIINWIQILNLTVENKELLTKEAFEKVVYQLIANLLDEIWEGKENEV